ncbi:MAG TPA: PIN domain-containing protein [Candidatus Sulfotelmatobacter sp.]|nr:PIN domain-containing protein [Candidatus Sulfotelmatobacter sp.]
MTNPVFLDASFWIDFRDEEALPHPLACQVVADIFRQRVPLVTTLPVICEIYAYFTRSIVTREMVLKELCENPIVTVEDISPQDQGEALNILRKHRDKEYSLCDALSFMVMRRLNIRRAVSFDKHFRQFGEFEVIPNKFP